MKNKIKNTLSKFKSDKEKPIATSDLFLELAESHKEEKISIGEIKEALSERGFAILLIIFGIPLLIPLPIPTGIGTTLSVPVCFFAWQMMVKADSPWLPSWIVNKKFKTTTFQMLVRKSNKYLKYIEKFLKRRLLTVSDSQTYESITGFFILTLVIPIAAPMPLSNNIPAAAIILMGFGMLEKDGVMILIGQAVGVLAWVVFIFFIVVIYYSASEAIDCLPLDWQADVKEFMTSYVPGIKFESEYAACFLK